MKIHVLRGDSAKTGVEVGGVQIGAASVPTSAKRRLRLMADCCPATGILWSTGLV